VFQLFMQLLHAPFRSIVLRFVRLQHKSFGSSLFEVFKTCFIERSAFLEFHRRLVVVR